MPPDSPYIRLDLPGYGSYEAALRTFLETAGPFVRTILFELDQEKASGPRILAEAVRRAFPETCVSVPVNGRLWQDIFDAAAEALQGVDESAELWWFWADAPLISPTISKEVSRLYGEHRADFAFADGYPKGISPEILFLPRLTSLRQLARMHGQAANRDGLFEVIQKDINSFHIETHISEGDHRQRRLELHGEYRRTHLLVRRLAEPILASESARTWSDEDFESTFEESRISQRSIPAHLYLQINARCPHACSYCPYPQINPGHLTDSRLMKLDRIRQLVDSLVEFMPEGTISLSPLGEPGLHPEILPIIRYLDEESPYEVLVETTGVGWQTETVNSLCERPPTKTKFVIGLDTNDPERYKRLGKTNMEEAQNLARGLLGAMPDKVYVQTVRVQGAEEDMLDFYRDWEKITPNIIIQKFDSYAGLLPDQKVVDLQPVSRFPCWHLKRQLTVLVDGTLVRCKEDIQSKHAVGNVFSDPIAALWEKLEPVYDAHRAGSYPDECGTCDEYYTFAF